MDFFRENRLVWVEDGDPGTGSPSGGLEGGLEGGGERKRTPEEQITDAQDDLRGKVGSAQTILEQLNAIYGEDEQGMDDDKSNNAKVVELNEMLEGILSGFEGGISEIKEDFEAKLEDLETELVTAINGVVEGEITHVEADDVSDVVAKGMTKAANIEGGPQDAEGVQDVVDQLQEERKVDRRHARGLTREQYGRYNRFVEAVTEIYNLTGADRDNLIGYRNELFDGYISKLKDIPAEEQSGQLRSYFEEIEAAFFKKVSEEYADGEEKDSIKEKIREYRKKEIQDEPLEERLEAYRMALDIAEFGKVIQDEIVRHAGDIWAAIGRSDAYYLTISDLDISELFDDAPDFAMSFDLIITSENLTSLDVSIAGMGLGNIPSDDAILRHPPEGEDGDVSIDPFFVDFLAPDAVTLEENSNGTYNIQLTKPSPDFLQFDLASFETPIPDMTEEDFGAALGRSLEENRGQELKDAQELLGLSDEDVAGVEREQKAAESQQIPPYQRRIAKNVLANIGTEQRTVFNAGRVMGEKAAQYAMSESSKYNIATHVVEEPRTGEGILVLDYTGAEFNQSFNSPDAFIKYYPTLHLPADDGSNGPFPLTEDVYLSKRRPKPFGGIRRLRDLSVTYERDDQDRIIKVNVTVSNIQFQSSGGELTSVVRVRLGKPVSGLQDPRDILYPPGYGGSKFGSPGEGMGIGAEGSETPEEKFDRLSQELTAYEELAEGLEKIGIDGSQLEQLPKFLQDRINYVDKDWVNLITVAQKAVEQGNLEVLEATMDKLLSKKELVECSRRIADGEDPETVIQDLPEFKEFATYQEDGTGLRYGGDSEYEASDFGRHFHDAAALADARFSKGDETGYVSFTEATFHFGPDHSIKGELVLKVDGYEGDELIRVKFHNYGAHTWEEGMVNGFDTMINSKAVNKAVEKQRRQRERMKRIRANVDEREQRSLKRRTRKAERARKKGEAFDPFSVPDYTASSRNNVQEKILKDHGDLADYRVKEVGGRWVAVRSSARKDTRQDPFAKFFKKNHGGAEATYGRVDADHPETNSETVIDTGAVESVDLYADDVDYESLSREDYKRYMEIQWEDKLEDIRDFLAGAGVDISYQDVGAFGKKITLRHEGDSTTIKIERVTSVGRPKDYDDLPALNFYVSDSEPGYADSMDDALTRAAKDIGAELDADRIERLQAENALEDAATRFDALEIPEDFATASTEVQAAYLAYHQALEKMIELSGSDEDAIPYREELFALEEVSGQVGLENLLSLGSAYSETGDSETAISYYEKAMDAASSAYEAMGGGTEGVQASEQWEQAYKMYHDSLTGLADLATETGDTESIIKHREAIFRLETAVDRLDGDNAKLLADAYAEAGRTEDAIGVYGQAITIYPDGSAEEQVANEALQAVIALWE